VERLSFYGARNYTEHADMIDFNPTHNTLNHSSKMAQIVKDALAYCHGISNANFQCASI
jgi:predicted SprT family Zn-dependent metalloprotease